MINNTDFKQFNDTAHKMQELSKAMLELGLRSMQRFNYLKPEDFTSVKKPEDFLENQMNLALNNSYNLLDYMGKSFELYEKTMRSCFQETSTKTDRKKG